MQVQQQTQPPIKVDLSFACKDLPSFGVGGKTDAQIVCSVNHDDAWVTLGKTETVKNTLSPKFSTSIPCEYHFDRSQPLKIEVFHIDNNRQNPIGEANVYLGEIVSGSNQRWVGTIEGKASKICGTLTITFSEQKQNTQNVRFICRARDLSNKALIGKSDPYVEIYKQSDKNKDWIVVHRTEIVLSSLDPVWKPFFVPMATLNGNDPSRPLKFKVYAASKGKGDLIGEFDTTLANLLAKKGAKYPIINQKKLLKKKKYTDSGSFFFDLIQVNTAYSFLDYISSGFEIQLQVAIDYTGSNGPVHHPSSLHYLKPGHDNDYQKAIRAVGSILLNYDTDGDVPVFGFGARFPDGRVSHCFAVNGNEDNPEVKGLDGIMKAYADSLKRVELWGPTNFAEIITTAAEEAKIYHESTSEQAFLILLIITDGEITDMAETVKAIVKASVYPLSIVIVGVGTADFGKMDILDGDDERLKSGSKVAYRDIVQFVAMRDFAHDANNARLTSATLNEIPGQFLHYMASNGIFPKHADHGDAAPKRPGAEKTLLRSEKRNQARNAAAAGFSTQQVVTTNGVNPDLLPPQVLYPQQAAIQPPTPQPQAYPAQNYPNPAQPVYPQNPQPANPPQPQPAAYPTNPPAYPTNPPQPAAYATNPPQPAAYATNPPQPQAAAYPSNPPQPQAAYPSYPDQPQGYPAANQPAYPQQAYPQQPGFATTTPPGTGSTPSPTSTGPPNPYATNPPQQQYPAGAPNFGAPPPPPGPVTGQAIGASRALYAYTGVSQSQLSFPAGAHIWIFNKDPSGWWEGEFSGVRGWFPSNYVQVL